MENIPHTRTNQIVPAIMLSLVIFCQLAAAQTDPWEHIAKGLDLGRFEVQDASVGGDSAITVLRIDPAYWDLRLLSISQTGDPMGMNAREWCEKYKLAAATNAGMFQQDYRTHVGYMKSGDHVNCRRKNDYKSAAAFGPLRPGLAPFRIFDLDVDNIDSVISRYANVIQNIRMISRAGENRWTLQPKQWSEAALGEDKEGRALFIFSRSPYAMHDLNRILLSLPIGLVCAQHLEGGPEAQVYLQWGKAEIELTGSYETTFNEDDLNQVPWPVPNVIGIVPKER